MIDKGAEKMAKHQAPADSEDDLALRLWEGDDSVKGDILKAWGGRVLLAIRKGYPTLSDDDVEDVVCEAMMRFWGYRSKYDPERAKVGTLLYRIATRVAAEQLSGQLAWQKTRLMEESKAAEFFDNVFARLPEEDPPDDINPKKSPVQRALEECWKTLPPLQQDILQTFADAGSYRLDAAIVGKDLGEKHKGGVPIPAGTIRTYRSRAWDSMDGCMKRKGFDLDALGYTHE